MQGVCIETGVGCISQRGVLEGFPGRGASRNYVDQPILAVNSTLGALRALLLIWCAHMRLLTVTAERFVEGLPQFSPSSKLGPQLCRRKPRFDCSHYCILRSASAPSP